MTEKKDEVVDDGPHKQTPWEIIKEEIVMVKWRVLLLCCFLNFGGYYIYDFPGSIGTSDTGKSIQEKFVSNGKEYSQEMNLALYAVYNWPNSVLAIFGGLLIDKYLGLRKSAFLFISLVLTGSVLFWIGVIVTSYPLMLVARVVFGMGNESMCVASNAFIVRWFKGKRGLALAFGISLSFSRVGSSLNFLVSPMVSDDISVDMACLFGAIACAISFVACSLLVFVDTRGQRKGMVPAETKDSAKPFSIKEIRDMPLLLWIACGICVFAYCAIFPWIGIAENFFQVKFGVSHKEAGRYVSVYQFTSAGCSPVVGFFVDALGRFCYWLIVANVGFVGVHLLFWLAAIPPPVMMVGMGLIYSLLASSLWPAIPYTVEAAHVGFAYGVITALQNFGLALYPLVIGAVLDVYTPSATTNTTTVAPIPHLFDTLPGNTTPAPPAQKPLPTLEGYYVTEGIFLATAGIATALAVAFFLIDRVQHDGMLAANPKVREEKKRRFMAEHAKTDETKSLLVSHQTDDLA